MCEFSCGHVFVPPLLTFDQTDVPVGLTHNPCHALHGVVNPLFGTTTWVLRRDYGLKIASFWRTFSVYPPKFGTLLIVMQNGALFMNDRGLRCFTAVIIQPPCSNLFLRAKSMVDADQSSTITSCVLPLIIAAENTRSFVTDTTKCGGIRLWNISLFRNFSALAPLMRH